MSFSRKRLKFIWNKCCIIPTSCLLYTFWSANLSNPMHFWQLLKPFSNFCPGQSHDCIYCHMQFIQFFWRCHWNKIMKLNWKLMHLSNISWSSLCLYLPMGYQFKNYFLYYATTVKKKKKKVRVELPSNPLKSK